ncbi:MAG TPA: response regulator transcription factor [Opitutaceae bacterium]|nr:response regulator transcription factor [Opitutaceae bacterium]
MPTETPAKIRVMLVDDHVLMRMGLSFALNSQTDMKVVAEAEDGAEAVELYRQHHPDVVLLDLRMPKQNGIETLSELRRQFHSVHVLVLSNYSNGHEVAGALQAGASGFLSKDCPQSMLTEAIREIAAGRQFLSPHASRHLAGRISSQLSQREGEVLALIAKGLSNKEIGASLGIAETTVKAYVTGILTKLGVADRTQAVLSAIKRGIVQVD